ncbi:MAG: DUF58 domain-containing protein [Spirillospora sp.]
MLGLGLWGAYPFIAALGAAALGAVLAAVLLTARTLHVEVRRSVYPGRVEKGEPAMARLRVNNPGGRRLAAFTTTDALGETTRTIRVRPLRPGAAASYTYEIPTGKRGRFTVGPLTLHRVDPLELARTRRPTGATDTLWVHPRQYPARAMTGGHRRHHHDGATTDDALRGSMELVDLRDYAPGDEFRLLHWKATARTGRLMVRDLADPEQPRFTLLLDTRTTTFAADLFEEAVDTAASLLAASARAGYHSRLITPAGLDVPMPGGPKAALRLLDELAQVGRDGARGTALVPSALSAGRGAGGVLVVVTSVSTRPAELARLRPRFPAIHMIVLADEKPVAVTVPQVRILGAARADEAVRRWNELATP